MSFADDASGVLSCDNFSTNKYDSASGWSIHSFKTLRARSHCAIFPDGLHRSWRCCHSRMV